LEPRADLAVGFIRLPEDRAASDRVSALTEVAHRSPQFLLFQEAHARFHLDEFAIVPDQLVPLLREHLPAEVGPPVRNEAVITLEPYRALLSQFLEGKLPEERFQWAYLDRLAKEALWRDDETFALLNSLFENQWGRDVRSARPGCSSGCRAARRGHLQVALWRPPKGGLYVARIGSMTPWISSSR
jgi:hypothetical protein